MSIGYSTIIHSYCLPCTVKTLGCKLRVGDAKFHVGGAPTTSKEYGVSPQGTYHLSQCTIIIESLTEVAKVAKKTCRYFLKYGKVVTTFHHQ